MLEVSQEAYMQRHVYQRIWREDLIHQTLLRALREGHWRNGVQVHHRREDVKLICGVNRTFWWINKPFQKQSYARFIDAHKAKRSREPVMLETAIVLVLNGIGSSSDMSCPSCKFCKMAAYPGLTSNLLAWGKTTVVVTHLHNCV